MIQHLDITVSGQVQAVGFRYYAKQTAERLGIKGTVQNMPDGTVRIEAEGTEAQLEQLVAWCRHGPDRANVMDLEILDGKIVGCNSFQII